ncbi:hypothetical protein VTN96DRAFT_7859 [Rasamsonia emersonii]
MAEEYPEGRLFGNPKASRALLQFLADTTIGCPRGDQARAVDRAHRDDEWGLEALEEAEQDVTIQLACRHRPGSLPSSPLLPA